MQRGPSMTNNSWPSCCCFGRGRGGTVSMSTKSWLFVQGGPRRPTTVGHRGSKKKVPVDGVRTMPQFTAKTSQRRKPCYHSEWWHLQDSARRLQLQLRNSWRLHTFLHLLVLISKLHRFNFSLSPFTRPHCCSARGRRQHVPSPSCTRQQTAQPQESSSQFASS